MALQDGLQVVERFHSGAVDADQFIVGCENLARGRLGVALGAIVAHLQAHDPLDHDAALLQLDGIAELGERCILGRLFGRHHLAATPHALLLRGAVAVGFFVGQQVNIVLVAHHEPRQQRQLRLSDRDEQDLAVGAVALGVSEEQALLYIFGARRHDAVRSLDLGESCGGDGGRDENCGQQQKANPSHGQRPQPMSALGRDGDDWRCRYHLFLRVSH